MPYKDIKKKRESNKKYRENHKEKIKEKNKEYYKKNKEKILLKQKQNLAKHREYNQKSYYKNKDKRIKKQLERYYKKKKEISERRKEYRNRPEVREKLNRNFRKRIKEDKNFAIRKRLRRLVNNAFKNYINNKKIMPSKKYGIDYQKIIEHLKPFPKNLSNYEIDHIKPLCLFQFTNKDGSINLEEIKKAFAPGNHQWLTKEENRRKSNKY